MSLKSPEEGTEIHDFKMSESRVVLEGIQIPRARWRRWQLLECEQKMNTLYWGRAVAHAVHITHTHTHTHTHTYTHAHRAAFSRHSPRTRPLTYPVPLDPQSEAGTALHPILQVEMGRGQREVKCLS